MSHQLSRQMTDLELSQAISRGQLEVVKRLLPDATFHWEALEASFLKACSCGQFKVVDEILRRMKLVDQIRFSERIKHAQSLGLDIVADNGNLKIVKKLCEDNPELLERESSSRYGLDMPIVQAAKSGHGDVTRYLYEKTERDVLMVDEGSWATCILLDAIVFGFLDIAEAISEQVLRQVQPLAVSNPVQWSSLLRFLAKKPDLFRSHCHLGFWGLIIYSCIFWKTPKWFGIKHIYELKDRHYKAQKLLQRICAKTAELEKNDIWKNTVYGALFEAVEYGNKEFFIEIIKCNPELLLISEPTSGQNLFLLAVKCKKDKIFNLIYGLDDRKVKLLRSHDNENNNILHLAARLSPSDHLSKVSGDALKMQRETRWYEEVKSLVSEREVVQKNNVGKTPRQVFEESHELLRKDGEKWMKYTATACSFVSVLIATVTFQAIFTAPGGYDGDSGKPVLIYDFHFTAFIIADALAFFASCISVLIFLSILTSRYSFDDFILPLPRKMILGLTILFLSISSMLVAFITALSSTMRQRAMLVVPMKPLASLPAILFLWLQYPLLKEMISSTYGNGIFHRNTKKWL